MTNSDCNQLQDFTNWPIDGDLYDAPIDELIEEQHQCSNDAKPVIRHKRLIERWQWFLSLAAQHGIHPCVVAAKHPSYSDRLEVIESAKHDDSLLRERKVKLCSDARVVQRQRDYEAGRWVPVDPNGEVIR